MDIYKIFRKWSTNYVKKIRQKTFSFLTSSCCSPFPLIIKHMIFHISKYMRSLAITNGYLQTF